MRQKYSSVVLRYIHDVTSGEFVNLGVVVFAPTAKYLGCLCTSRYGRVSRFFGEGRVSGQHLRDILRWLQDRIDELGSRIRGELDLGQKPLTLSEALASVLPLDDSSLQWSHEMGGITSNAERTLEELYARFVEKYERPAVRRGRDDAEVWRSFKAAFQTERVLAYLKPHLIRGRDYEYNFDYALRNGRWNVYEPISMDLIDAETIVEKAVRWLGRAQGLSDADEDFTLFALLGPPSDERLRSAYMRARNIMKKMTIRHEFVEERDATELARVLRQEIREAPSAD